MSGEPSGIQLHERKGTRRQMSHLGIQERHTGPVVILDLDGQLALGSGSTELRNVVTRMLNNGSKKILLNLKGVTYMDSSGLGELVSASARTIRQGGELKLINVAGRVYGLLAMTKLVTVFETFDSEDEALRSFEQVREASS
jgi:anti-sigma B factor antagonist